MAYLQGEVYPVLLGGTGTARRTLGALRARAPRGAALLAAKKPLFCFSPRPLCFCAVTPKTEDALLLSILADVATRAGECLPLLVVCEPRFYPFALRCREELERCFVLRFGAEMEVEP